jgi:hypothetical protein
MHACSASPPLSESLNHDSSSEPSNLVFRSDGGPVAGSSLGQEEKRAQLSDGSGFTSADGRIKHSNVSPRGKMTSFPRYFATHASEIE